MPRVCIVLLLCILGLWLTVGCSQEERSLKKYANATLTAGTGLGDLLLGTTTLDWFIRNIGKERMALVVGDESAFEFDIRDGQMAFQFLVNGTCEKEIAVSRDLRSSVNDFDAYLERHPGCRDLTLSSISVGKGSKFKGTFYKGATEKGATLGSPITATFNHGTARKAAARLVAGLSLGNPEDVLEYRGISFHYDRGSSGKMEDTVIARMTVFSEIESSD